MKKIILGAVVASIFAGAYTFANISYNEQVDRSIGQISNNLKETGYDLSYSSIESNILDDYIKINNVKLIQGIDTFTVDSVVFHRDSFGTVPNEKPELIEFKLDDLTLSDSYDYKGTFDVEYIYNYNSEKGKFLNRGSLSNDDLMKVSFELSLNNANSFWNCMGANTVSCPISTKEEDLTRFLGDLNINNLEIGFENKGIIKKEMGELYNDVVALEDFKNESVEEIKGLKNISEENKKALINFIIHEKSLIISLSQDKNKKIIDLVKETLSKLESNQLRTPDDFIALFLKHINVTLKS